MATISHSPDVSHWDQPVRPLVGVAVFGLCLLLVMAAIALGGLAFVLLVLV
jgi:hypothetical protein